MRNSTLCFHLGIKVFLLILAVSMRDLKYDSIPFGVRESSEDCIRFADLVVLGGMTLLLHSLLYQLRIEP